VLERPEDAPERRLRAPAQRRLGLAEALYERGDVRLGHAHVGLERAREVALEGAHEGGERRLVRLLCEGAEGRRDDLGREGGRGWERGEERVERRAVVGRGRLARAQRGVHLLGDGGERRLVVVALGARRE